MQTLVIDSSVIVKWLHQEDELYIKHSDKIIENVTKGSIELFSPELAKYEVANALLLKKKLSAPQATISLASLYSLPIQFIPLSEDVANETYRIAASSGITYYDASFLSLAKYYDAILVTDNIKHQSQDLTIKVIALKDY